MRAIDLSKLTRAILAQAQQQIPAILEDADPEPLHQFRVNLRRLRVLVAFAPELSKKKRARLRRGIKQILANSGQLRDLDLLPATLKHTKLTGYYLSPKQQQSVFTLISQRRKKAWRGFSSHVRSAKFEQNMKRLDNRLNRWLQLSQVSTSGWSIQVAQQQAQLMRQLKTLPATARSSELHETRIAAKTLRYLAEVNRNRDRDCATHYKAARSLQSELGILNDHNVHRRLLSTLRQTGFARKAGLKRPLRQLIRALKTEEKQLRSQQIEVVRRLSSPSLP